MKTMNLNNGVIQSDISLRQAAIIAGFGLLAMFIFGVLADFVALSNIIVWQDAATAVKNIVNFESQFQLGVSCYLGLLVADVNVALEGYKESFFKRCLTKIY